VLGLDCNADAEDKRGLDIDFANDWPLFESCNLAEQDATDSGWPSNFDRPCPISSAIDSSYCSCKPLSCPPEHEDAIDSSTSHTGESSTGADWRTNLEIPTTGPGPLTEILGISQDEARSLAGLPSTLGTGEEGEEPD